LVLVVVALTSALAATRVARWVFVGKPEKEKRD